MNADASRRPSRMLVVVFRALLIASVAGGMSACTRGTESGNPSAMASGGRGGGAGASAADAGGLGAAGAGGNGAAGSVSGAGGGAAGQGAAGNSTQPDIDGGSSDDDAGIIDAGMR